MLVHCIPKCSGRRVCADIERYDPLERGSKSGLCGSQGNGKYSAECPFVYYHNPSGCYYLLRNQFYGERAQFTVYRSKNPLDFGQDNDRYMVETMPFAAPEIVESEGQTYLAVLLANLKGIQMAKLKFALKS